VDEDVGAIARLMERGWMADVALSVLHLRESVLRGVEWPPGDADYSSDPRIGLEQWQKPRAQRAGGAGDSDHQVGVWRGHRC
jgi:hypothetical protein